MYLTYEERHDSLILLRECRSENNVEAAIDPYLDRSE